MRRIEFLISSCFVAILLALVVTIYLKKNKQVAHASQPEMGDGAWTTYTTAHGLPSDKVHRVVVDDNGQIWAGFQKGNTSNPYNEIMGRFDGYTWTNYFLSGCTVTALVANEDDIYAGTRCGGGHANQGYGLHWFVDGTWVDFMPSDGDGMQGTYIEALAVEGDTKVWFSANYLDVCYQFVNLLDHKGTADKADDEWTIYDFSIWGICTVADIAIDPDGNRWFGTWQDVRVLTSDNVWITHDDVDVGSEITFDDFGNVWVGQSQSVFKYDGVAWVEYDSRKEAIESNFDELMTSINKNWYGGFYHYLWVVEEPAGVWVLNKYEDVQFFDGQEWTIFTPDYSGLSSDDLGGMAVDDEGSIWFANRIDTYNQGGLNKFTPHPNYSLQAAPITIFLEQGQETTANVDVTHLRGWVPTATLTVTGLHPDVSAVFDTNPVTPTAQVQLTLISTQTAPLRTYYINLIASTEAGLFRTVNLTLYIVEEAFYDYLPAAFQ